jgi:hypothetical protein
MGQTLYLALSRLQVVGVAVQLLRTGRLLVLLEVLGVVRSMVALAVLELLVRVMRVEVLVQILEVVVVVLVLLGLRGRLLFMVMEEMVGRGLHRLYQVHL